MPIVPCAIIVWAITLRHCSFALILPPRPIHTLLLCRHGDSIWNGGQAGCEEKFTGWTDVPLTAKGQYEALQAGHEVQNYNADIDVCFTSILQRAQHTTALILQSLQQHHQPPIIMTDYRLCERHYGALQGYSKRDVERGVYGHDAADVQAWRRLWHAVPPLLTHHDPRRIQEIQWYARQCGGSHHVPRGESLEMVARTRIRPFVDDMATLLDDISPHGGGATALIVAHANSLRTLIGVICEVEDNPIALSILESLRIPTGVPLVLNYQRNNIDGKYHVCALPTSDECVVDYLDGPGLARAPPPDLGHASLPVWPLNQCLPVRQHHEAEMAIRH